MRFNLHTDTLFKYNFNTFKVSAVWHKLSEIYSVEFEQGAIVNGYWKSRMDVEPYHKLYSLIKTMMDDDKMEYIGTYRPITSSPSMPVKNINAREVYDALLKINPALEGLRDKFYLEIIV